MPNSVQTYVFHDSDPDKRGAIRIKREDARMWNEKGYGVFHTVQGFFGPRRIEKLVHINSWALDMDSGTKEEMWATLQRGLIPTMIVETKRGYQPYWKAKDGTRENWRHIVENRLVPYYNADKKAKDLARILRTPGFYHLKDPKDPFLIKVLHKFEVEYSEAEMFHFYKDLVTPKKQKLEHRKTIKAYPEHHHQGFWDLVWNLNCEYALSKLSGTEHVRSETYDFKPNSNGTRQIHVNGKSTSCWIDHEGRIGSLDEGGPTIAQWLNWFHKDYSKVIKIIKEVFPECQNPQTILSL